MIPVSCTVAKKKYFGSSPLSLNHRLTDLLNGEEMSREIILQPPHSKQGQNISQVSRGTGKKDLKPEGQPFWQTVSVLVSLHIFQCTKYRDSSNLPYVIARPVERCMLEMSLPTPHSTVQACPRSLIFAQLKHRPPTTSSPTSHVHLFIFCLSSLFRI